MIMRWNTDKKHRCPNCHAIPEVGDIKSWRTYVCCGCFTSFTRWPRLGWLWPKYFCDDPGCPYLLKTREEWIEERRRQR